MVRISVTEVIILFGFRIILELDLSTLLSAFEFGTTVLVLRLFKSNQFDFFKNPELAK